MDRSCNTHRREDDFGGKVKRREKMITTTTTTTTNNNNNNMDLKDNVWDGMNWILLRIMTNGGLF
jgi:hypothetical protein